MPGKITWGTGSSSDEKTIFIRMSVDGDPIWFNKNFESAAVGKIIRESITYEMDKLITEIRDVAYERGRQSARDKSKKINVFSGCLNSPQHVGHWED